MSKKLQSNQKVLIYELYPRAWRGGFREMERFLPQIANLFGLTDERNLQQECDHNLFGRLFLPNPIPAEVPANVEHYVWLAPFYPSGGFDGGYDVVDYCAVDPRFGSLSDFDSFVNTASYFGIKILIDLVPNHTSRQHRWYQEALNGSQRYRDYYHHSKKDLGWSQLWTDGKPRSAWVRESGNDYFLHTFSDAQVDLNWDNPAVLNEFRSIMDFWLERGIAGFRIDCCQLLGKTHNVADPRQSEPIQGLSCYYNLPKNNDILHKLFDPYPDVFTVGETMWADNASLERLAGPSGPLTMALDAFLPNIVDEDINLQGRRIFDLNRWSNALRERCYVPGFVAHVESHDLPRFYWRRFEDWRNATIDQCSAVAKEVANRLVNANPQGICIYQGQEFGEKNPHLSYFDAENDPETRSKLRALTERSQADDLIFHSRENARQPLTLVRIFPWEIERNVFRKEKNVFYYSSVTRFEREVFQTYFNALWRWQNSPWQSSFAEGSILDD